MPEQNYQPQRELNTEALPARKRRIWPFFAAIALVICAFVTVAVIASAVMAYSYVDDITFGIQEIVPTQIHTPSGNEGSGLSFSDIQDMRHELTNSEWRTYLRSIVGENVKWSGYVDHVDDYGQIWIDMEPATTENDTPDVYLRLDKSSSEYLSIKGLEPGRPIIFSGGIKGVESIQTPMLDSFVVSINGADIEVK